MAEVELHIEQRRLEPGRPVIFRPAHGALYAAYDPNQIHEEAAIAAISLLAPDLPDSVVVTRAGDGR